jgi:hypothetical protein
VLQKSGDFTLRSSFQFDMLGADLPYNRDAQFVVMTGSTGSQDAAIVHFQMSTPFEACVKKSNLRGKEVGPSHCHAMTAKRIRMDFVLNVSQFFLYALWTGCDCQGKSFQTCI